MVGRGRRACLLRDPGSEVMTRRVREKRGEEHKRDVKKCQVGVYRVYRTPQLQYTAGSKL